MTLVRWKAFIPLALVLALVAAVWVLLLDTIVRRSVEQVGAEIVGARVDVAEADVDLAHGQVTLRDLQVTNPESPLRNLFEAREIMAAVRVLPLLEKKVVIDTMAIRDVRFGTPRRTSGALAKRSATSRMLAERIAAWADQIRLPPLSLEGLGRVVDVSAISADSLRTLRLARTIAGQADSARQEWESRLRASDPRPVIDSARALAARLQGASVRTLGLAGARDAVASVRSTLENVQRVKGNVVALEQGVVAGVTRLRAAIGELGAARAADFAYARGLLKLPSLDAPDISPAVFGDIALARLKPVLYWINVAEQYLPPGLDPRRRPGPDRIRRAGLTVEFPRSRAYPAFLLEFAEASLTIGGSGAAAGEYLARAAGVTSSPALYGRPTRVLAGRTGGRVGPREVRLAAVLDHVRLPVRDSVEARVAGLALPAVTVAPLKATLAFGEGTTDIAVRRTGDSLAARWVIRSDDVAWTRLADSGGAAPNRAGGAPAMGSRAWAEDLLWRTVAGLKRVEVEARLSGALARPRLAVGSNVGTELAQSLKREIGAEIERAERLVRAKVDSLAQTGVREADTRVQALQSEVLARVTQQREELERVQAELEARLRELLPRIGNRE